MKRYEYKDDTDREMLKATTLDDAIVEATAILTEAVRGNADHLDPGTYYAGVIEWDHSEHSQVDHSISVHYDGDNIGRCHC
jgi:hypothetical protein